MLRYIKPAVTLGIVIEFSSRLNFFFPQADISPP